MNGRDKRKRARAKAERLRHPVKPDIDRNAAEKLACALTLQLANKAAA